MTRAAGSVAIRRPWALLGLPTWSQLRRVIAIALP
jgi:hypothetical protein